MKRFYVCLITAIGLHAVAAADAWGYQGENGPNHWPGVCVNGKKQSPINIETEHAIKADLETLTFVNYNSASQGNITNTGHTVQIQFEGMPIHLTGGGLSDKYILEQMHFHWPAEHTIDGKQSAVELHFVHYSSQYKNVNEAAQHENGVAVVATFFELSREDNIYLKPVVKGAELVSKWVGKNTAAINAKISPISLLPKDHATYYRYEGSLTTPGCQESVMWFILPEKQKISEQQLSIFKSVGTNSGPLTYNNRPLQPIGDRTIHQHLEGYSGAASKPANIAFVFPVLLVRLLQLN